MAKNITIETSNGALVLTGTKKATVTAKGGQLIIDLGNGETKTYPLGSVLGWNVGAAAKDSENKFIAAEKKAIADLASGLVAVREAVENDAPDAILRDLCVTVSAAGTAITWAKMKQTTYAAMLAAGKEKRAAKKVAAHVETAPVVEVPVAAPAAAANVLAAITGKGKSKKTAA